MSCSNSHSFTSVWHDTNTGKSLSVLFWFSLRRHTDRVHSSCQWQHCETQLSLFLSLSTLWLVSVISADTVCQLCVRGSRDKYCCWSFRWQFFLYTDTQNYELLLELCTWDSFACPLTNHQWDLFNMSFVSLKQHLKLNGEQMEIEVWSRLKPVELLQTPNMRHWILAAGCDVTLQDYFW